MNFSGILFQCCIDGENSSFLIDVFLCMSDTSKFNEWKSALPLSGSSSAKFLLWKLTWSFPTGIQWYLIYPPLLFLWPASQCSGFEDSQRVSQERLKWMCVDVTNHLFSGFLVAFYTSYKNRPVLLVWKMILYLDWLIKPCMDPCYSYYEAIVLHATWVYPQKQLKNIT